MRRYAIPFGLELSKKLLVGSMLKMSSTGAAGFSGQMTRRSCSVGDQVGVAALALLAGDGGVSGPFRSVCARQIYNFILIYYIKLLFLFDYLFVYCDYYLFI
jgi:hypothetical protein